MRTQNLVESHRIELERVKLELRSTAHTLPGLERKWSKVQLTPYGYRRQQRPRRDIHSLSQSGGHAMSNLVLFKNGQLEFLGSKG